MTWRHNKPNRKIRTRALNWPEVGPLRRDVNRLFSSLAYQDESGPLPLTVWYDQHLILILTKTDHLDAKEVDIAVADQSLLLSFTGAAEGGEPEARVPAWEGEWDLQPYVIQLPYRIDVNQIDTSFDDDLLQIRLLRLKGQEPEEDLIQYLQ
jgi:HSP20 family molecular chaperone IbpA